MNMFLANVAMLLADGVSDAYGGGLPSWFKTLISAVKNVINPVLIVVATAGILYSIVVGVKFVKADTKDEREEAKQKLITVIIGIVVTVILVVAFYWLAAAFQNGWINMNRWSD